MAVNSENLETAKFLDITEEDLKFERRVGQLRRQEYLVGGASELKKLVVILAVVLGCVWGCSNFQGSTRNFFHSVLKAKEVFGSMAGELNQEKKIWNFVDK